MSVVVAVAGCKRFQMLILCIIGIKYDLQGSLLFIAHVYYITSSCMMYINE